jgi:hypothetical protein
VYLAWYEPERERECVCVSESVSVCGNERACEQAKTHLSAMAAVNSGSGLSGFKEMRMSPTFVYGSPSACLRCGELAGGKQE